MTYRKRNPIAAFFLNDWIPTWGGRRISVAEALGIVLTPLALIALVVAAWCLS